MLPHPFRTQILALLLLPSLAAQGSPGYRTATQPLPAGAGQVLRLDATHVVYFTGTKLLLDDGNSQRTLLQFQSAVFGSFTRDLGDGRLLFGENSNDGVWLVPLAPNAQPRRLAGLALNYDAVRWNDRYAIVSAKTGGFPATTNDLFAVDLETGATDRIAVLPGASGPVACDAHGNVYYATASLSFPPPPAATELLLLPRAKVRAALGAGELSRTDAELLHAGLDTASALALDRDGDAFVVDWKNRRVLELDDVLQRNVTPHVLLDYAQAAVDPLGLQFAGAGEHAQAVFEPFQPAGGGMLFVQESDFTGTDRLRSLTAARAVLHCVPGPVVPPGAFTLTTQGAAAQAQLVVAIGLGHGHGELALPTGLEQPLHWHLPLLHPLATFFVTTGSDGSAKLPLVNPGVPFPLPLTAQSAFLTLDRRTIGSAAPVRCTLR